MTPGLRRQDTRLTLYSPMAAAFLTLTSFLSLASSVLSRGLGTWHFPTLSPDRMGLLSIYLYIYIYRYTDFFFCIFRATPCSIWRFQARSRIGAVATSLCHSHRNPTSEPHLWPTPQLTARRLSEARIEPSSSWMLVRFLSTETL